MTNQIKFKGDQYKKIICGKKNEPREDKGLGSGVDTVGLVRSEIQEFLRFTHP